MDLDYNESARSQLSVSAVSRSVVTQNACDSQSMYGDKAACLMPDRKQTREDGGGGGDKTQPSPSRALSKGSGLLSPTSCLHDLLIVHQMMNPVELESSDDAEAFKIQHVWIHEQQNK